MEQKELRELEAKCIQEEPPGCTTNCPVHVDARGLIETLNNKDFKKGYNLFQQTVPFPRIISRICDQPCRKGCKRKEIDESININALERFIVDNIEPPPVKNLPVRAKAEKIAVIGGGLSGLTVAYELVRKGYNIVIFEATEVLGGSIRDIPENVLPRQAIEDDFAPIKNNSLINIRLNTLVGNHRDAETTFDNICNEFDVVYLGVGTREIDSLELGLECDSNGNLKVDPVTLATSHPKVFAGGSLYLGNDNKSPINSIYQGKKAAISIDRLMQKTSLTSNREREGPYPTTLYTSLKGVKPEKQVPMSDSGKGYSIEEALQEANRCLLCECLECVKVCEFLAHYRSYPKRYVREVYNNLSIVMGIHHANKMINSCSLCGLCEEVCPNNLNMGQIIHEARKEMVRRGKMPPSAHDFALRDMEFSTGEKFVLNRHQPGFRTSKGVFFPGCQLSGSSPQHVSGIYRYLCEKISGGVGLSLGCCGAPALWSGREELFKENLKTLEKNWVELGKPKIITGCPTCYRVFKDWLPQIDVETIWTALDEVGLPETDVSRTAPKRLAVHDACTTRQEAELHNSIRNILRKLGHTIVELDTSCQTTECCGFGGLMMFANRDLAKQVVDRRIQEAEEDYLAYCAMCRDNFVKQGKRTYHLLDLIFGVDSEEQKAPDFSQRRENRARCKQTLLKEIWGEDMVEETSKIKLIITDEIRELLEDRMILVDDLKQVIEHAETTGNRLKNMETGRYIAYYKPAVVTYWVEYTPQEGGFLIHNAYSHRLEIS